MNHFKLIPLEERVVFDGAAAAHILYVNANAHSGGNGLSWGSAFNDLQTAINTADHLTGSTQIWVAKGTYTPDAVLANPSSATFSINDPNPLAIYGGFKVGATNLSQSNPVANPTILNGVLSGGGNVDTIVTISGGTVTLNGLTISGANNPSSSGGGVLENNATLTVANDIFTNDLVGFAGGFGGGGIASFNSNLTVTNSTFTNNVAGQGAAVEANGDTTLTITSSLIKNNNDYIGLDGGGGFGAIYAVNTQNVSISSNTITYNNGGVDGGITVFSCNNVTIQSNILDNNTGNKSEVAGVYGDGGGEVTGSQNLIINLNTIDNNLAGVGDAGFFTGGNTNVFITNNIFNGNIGLGTTVTGGGGSEFDTNILVSGNLFSNNSAVDAITHSSVGGGWFVGGASVATVTNNTFINNVADYGGGLITGGNATLTISHNLFINNSANFAGAAISSGDTVQVITEYFGSDGTVNIFQNVFTNNKAGTFGGAVASQDDVSVTLNQNVFTNNTAAIGGAISDTSSMALSITQDFFAGNSATQGNSLWLDGGQTTVNGLLVASTQQSVLIAQLVNANVGLFSDDILIA